MPQWLPILRRKGCPPLFYSYINHGYKDAYHQEMLGIPQGINFHRYVDGWVIIDLVESETFQRTFSQRIDEDGYLDFFLARCRDVSDELFAFGAERRGRHYAGEPASTLLIDFMRFSSLSIRAMPFLTTMVLLQDVVESRLRRALSAAMGVAEDDEAITVYMLELMLEESEVPLATQSVRDITRLGHLVASHHPDLAERLSSEDPPGIEEITDHWPDLAGEIEAHLARFDFLGTDYYVGEPLTGAQVLEQVKTVVVQQQRDDKAEPEHHPEAPVQLGTEDRELLRRARELHFLRQHRIEAMFKAGREVRGLLTELGSRIGLSYDEVLSLTFDEVQQSLTAGEPCVPLSLIAERLRDYGVTIEEGVARIVVGEELAVLRDALPPGAATDGRLSGVTAFPGACEAPATVVDRLQDVGVVNAGDVLVAPMTSPYHVPAMVIASAVVTDEGGILSHASIVSRELGIPCVVGVAGATEAIATGQHVRVDALGSVGTVEILDGR